VLLAGALALWGRLPFPGALFFYLVAGYGVGRFWMEFTRAKQDIVIGLALHAAISALLVGVALIGFVAAWPWWR
jgi:prolipoprotein diacylglyceryltransferase